MIRIAFLGSDSTHTEAFAKQINNENSPFYNQARVVSIWGENHDQAATKAHLLKIPKVAQTPEEALENVDLAMVIGRFGDSHFLPAKKALEAGIPTFVDKPFTLSFKEAEILADFAQKKNNLLCSCSPLRFCKEVKEVLASHDQLRPMESLTVSAPLYCLDLQGDARFKSVFFYGIHGIEVLLEILGDQVESVQIVKGLTSTEVLLQMGEKTALLHFVDRVDEFYSFQIFRKQETRFYSIALDESYYPGLLSFLLEEFIHKKRTIPLSSTLKAISILEEVQHAL